MKTLACSLGLAAALALSGGATCRADTPPSVAASQAESQAVFPAASSTAPAASSPTAPSIKANPGYQDPALLAKAWLLPVAARYKPHIEFQRNLSFCGPTSLANVHHSLQTSSMAAVDQSAMLEDTGVSTFMGYLPQGLTLDELARIARQKLGRHVTLYRGLDLPAFRQHLRQANDVRRRYIVNFSRAPLFGTGGGHHSPIAGYLEAEDLVLVLDVNSDFGPWLVTPERLLQAMNTLDGTSGRARGLLLID